MPKSSWCACASVVLACALPAHVHAQQRALTTTALAPLELSSVAPSTRELTSALVLELRRVWHAVEAPALPRWGRAVRAVERLVGLPWRGATPIVLLVPDGGQGFACDGGECAGRFEATRLVTTNAERADTVVVGVILLAESAMMREDVWEHELTHALLAQHSLIEASTRHDPRYFPRARSAIAIR